MPNSAPSPFIRFPNSMVRTAEIAGSTGISHA